MKYFIFRNSTVENFFGNQETSYSGYDDISTIPETVDVYVWFYLLPLRVYQEDIIREINSLQSQFELVLEKISLNSSKIVVAFTLTELCRFRICGDDFRLDQAIAQYNMTLWNLAKKYPNLKVLQLSDFLQHYPAESRMDWKYYFLSQMQLNPRLSSDFRLWFTSQMSSILQQRKKCLVLDLDNTLWGGILGEDGVENLQIGEDYPGNAYLLFQKYLFELGQAGVILTVCSKNNERDVLDAWKNNPNFILRQKHFAAYRINWNNKADNIVELSQELNIGLDSIVFVDDNPTERELIKQTLPMVAVPDFPKSPYELPVFVQQMIQRYFSIYHLTHEDQEKTIQYQANAQRSAAQKQFSDFSDYIRSLEIHLEIRTADTFSVPRIAQMTQKTNQFNLTTHRYTESDIWKFIHEHAQIYTIRVKDKFGDSGITGLIILTPNKSSEYELEIDTFLLSCRILGKGIETEFINQILLLLQKQGVQKIRASYIPTAKNGQVADFYDRHGFQLSEQSSLKLDEKRYQIDLANAEIRTSDLLQTDTYTGENHHE